MTRAVLIHGRHLGAPSWEDLVWGAPPERLGNVPRGILEAVRTNASLIYWGTGSSEKDGEKDSEWALNMAQGHVHELASLCGTDVQTVDTFLNNRSYLDTITRNTTEEVENCMKICNERGIEAITLASSPSHIARCVMTALILCEQKEEYMPFLRTLSIAVSDVPYAHSTLSDVVVIEPPHRGDLPALPIHHLAKATINLIRTPRFTEYLAEWEALLRKFGYDA